MLKKRLGIEGIERDWPNYELKSRFKVSPTIIIPEGCMRIGDYAFWRFWDLKEVKIPGSVEEIGFKAFYSCIELEEVIIPGNVEYIGDCAFCDCRKAKITVEKLENRYIKRYISPDAFNGCKDVKEETRN